MSGEMISPAPAQRIDTVVADPVTGEQRRRTDYAGTVWYGEPPQMTRGIVISRGAGAQITTPFWLPDSHVYRAEAAGEAQVQASAAVQSMVDHCQILEVGASLGQDPQNTGGLLVYMAVTAAGRLPLGVAYRVTVICAPEALQSPTT
ncbi:MAG: hypothetical protein M3550_04315 [Actinomycetota bacterium]|nr:hypothetical protein [Actinomycetota bacterium]